MSTTILPLARPAATPLVAEQHRLDVGRVGHHHEDDVGALGDAARVDALRGARRGDGLGHLAARVHEQLVAGGDQVAAMGAPMMPRPMKPILREGVGHGCRSLVR